MGESSLDTQREAHLGEICHLNGGSVFPKRHQGKNSGDFPFIKVSDFNIPGNEFFITHSNNWVSRDLVQDNRLHIHPAGAVVFPKIGIALTTNRRRILARPTIIDNNLMSAAPRESVDTRFFYYLLTTIDFNTIAQGSALPYLTQEAIGKLLVKTPPLAEQRRIAHILGTLDDKIELNRRMNATLEAIARALFKSWFVDFDPVRAKAAGRPSGLPPALDALFPSRFVDSELGEIPEGWEVKALDEIADFLNGLALQKYPPKTMQKSLSVIKIREMRQGYSAATDKASSDIDSKYIIKDGDLLFSWSGSLLAKFWTEGRGALNQHLFKVTSEHYPAWFYYLWLQHHMPQFQEVAAGKATTMGHIQRHHLSAAKCLVPPRSLLDLMTELVQPMTRQLVGIEVESKTLARTRESLLPRLMVGDLL